ncbi:MAG: thioredoxin domain-containing protein [Cyanobacteria bacterium J06639_1]
MMTESKRWLYLALCIVAVAIASCTSAPQVVSESPEASPTVSDTASAVSQPLADSGEATSADTDPGSPDAPDSIDPELEAQVLAILRKHPQVVIDSVETYRAQQRLQQQAQQQSQQLAALRPMAENPAVFIGTSPTLGSRDRQYVLYEFSDFQCPFCARSAPIVKEFLDKRGDEVTLVYKHLPLERIHPEAVPAAIASHAAQQQGKFWDYHDELFARQRQLGEETYLAIAEDLDLDLDRFNADRDKAEADVRLDLALSDRLEVRSTPFFALNGIPLSGAPSVEQFEALLERVKQNET